MSWLSQRSRLPLVHDSPLRFCPTGHLLFYRNVCHFCRLSPTIVFNSCHLKCLYTAASGLTCNKNGKFSSGSHRGSRLTNQWCKDGNQVLGQFICQVKAWHIWTEQHRMNQNEGPLPPSVQPTGPSIMLATPHPPPTDWLDTPLLPVSVTVTLHNLLCIL